MGLTIISSFPEIALRVRLPGTCSEDTPRSKGQDREGEPRLGMFHASGFFVYSFINPTVQEREPETGI